MDWAAFRAAVNEFAGALTLLADIAPVSAALACYDVLRTIADSGGADLSRRGLNHEALMTRLGETASIGSLASAFIEEVERLSTPHFATRFPRRPAVVRAQRFIEDHAEEPVSLARVAREVGVTRTYLSALFRRECGVTLTQYIHQVRIRRAEALLRHGGLSISEVAARSGYGSYRHFHRSFLRLRRVSPRAFLKSVRAAAIGGPPAPGLRSTLPSSTLH